MTAAYHPGVEIECADCGCIVDRGVVMKPCGTPTCCCNDLPIASRTESPSS